ncbi:MAG: hypothetical protein ACXABV_05920 [Candidatus Thorarchaeota archaeon]|jgi:hypothetical protein
MFVGHYGVAFALKKYNPKLSLGFLFIAVQLVDIAFFILLPLGIENARIVPGFTEASSFDLYNFPITHSLVGSLAWTVAAFLVIRFIPLLNSTKTDSEKQRTALIMSIGLLSHYFLDFLVHTPDLLLVPGIDVKIGLGLWNSIIATLSVELVILLGGGWIYFQSTSSGIGPVSKYGMFAFIIVLVIITIATPFQSFPDMLTAAALSEFLYVVLALTAFWLDSRRSASIS